jgi:hypothetical protein
VPQAGRSLAQSSPAWYWIAIGVARILAPDRVVVTLCVASRGVVAEQLDDAPACVPAAVRGFPPGVTSPLLWMARPLSEPLLCRDSGSFEEGAKIMDVSVL